MESSIDASLVRIYSKAGRVVGAGFLVSKRHVLTCAHVIAEALGQAENIPDKPTTPISLDFPRLASHTILSANVVFWEPAYDDGRGDIAGLELLDDPPAGVETIHFSPADQVWDHPFRVLGFPNGFDDGVWATGRLLGRQGANWIQIEDIKSPGFAVISGFSGAPVWDTQLQGIVGMIVAASQQTTTKTAFVIPADMLVAAWPDLTTLMRPSVPRNPYKGLHAFTENDSRDFFGRDSLIDEFATAIETALTREQKEGQHARLLAVLGPSGSGKSSAAMAGLLPRLRKRGILNSDEWIYLDPLFPGVHPLEALAISLSRLLPARGAVSLHKDLVSTSARSLHLLVSQLVSSPQQKVVLLVDQFEEIFTLTPDEAERKNFFELLVTAVTEPRGPLYIILTLRADFYDRPMNYAELFRLIDNNHVSVLPMERNELRSVIEQPANLPEVQLSFESGLVDELLLDMQGQSGALPLLEFTLDQLVQRRTGYQLTLQAYHDLGGVKGALSQHAEEIYQGLPSEAHRQAARDLFLRLIEPGTTEQDTTRHRALRSEFELADRKQARQMQETLETFIEARLLTINQIGGRTTVEVSHEALIREWKRLQEWLRSARDDIRFQRSLSEDVAEWEQRKQPGDRLYRGQQLKEARRWAARNKPSEQEAAFLQASVIRRTRSLASITVVLLLLASSLGVAGWYVFLQPKPTLVTTLQDNVVGSLRWCINNASAGSTINFAQGMHGTMVLTGGSLVIAGGKQLTVVGPGAKQLAITGGASNAIIHISKGATLNISSLSFKNSTTIADAFIFNEGTLSISNSVISGNKTTAGIISTSYGGGIENKGTLSVTNSLITNNSASGGVIADGGGIYNEGTLTVIHSTFLNNSASSSVINAGVAYGTALGGGIENFGTSAVIIMDSVFSNNSSMGAVLSYGGAIAHLSTGTLTVMNTTFSGNSSTGGTTSYGGSIDNVAGTLTVTDSSFSGNSSTASKQDSRGGGIENSGKLTVTHSTFIKNTIQAKQNAQGGGIDNNGTLTISQSIFSNNSASSSNFNSFGGGIVNNSSGTLTVTDSTFSGNNVRAQQDAVAGALYNGGKLSLSKITFSNNSANSSNLNSFGSCIDNYTTGTATVTNSTFSYNSIKAKLYAQGGCIENDGKLILERTAFSNNSASSSNYIGTGGGIVNNTPGTLMVMDSTFSGDSANGMRGSEGGGIYDAGKQLTIINSTLSGNSAKGKGGSFGGGILYLGLKGNSVIIAFSTIYGNTANAGGGIWIDPRSDNQVTVSSSIIAANNAAIDPDIAGTLISGGYNLIENETGATGLNTTTDKQVTLAALKVDSTLNNNGGPTQTLALHQGSIAIDSVPLQACSITVTDAFGQKVTITTDQVGNPRPDGSENTCDVGGYESSY